MKRVIIFYILLIGMTASLSAQLKIGYILSERIRGEYEEFKEAESQLQLEYRKVQFEFDQSSDQTQIVLFYTQAVIETLLL